eukprot:m.407689 g.407689  ORF g.407689 m.407689 type:complete len:93 (-) comp16799_c2_seq6:80-358(-)
MASAAAQPMAVAGTAVSDTVVISVQLGAAGAAEEVELSRRAASADIKEAILVSLGRQPGTVFRLFNSDRRVVVVDCNLQPGKYVVDIDPPST